MYKHVDSSIRPIPGRKNDLKSFLQYAYPGVLAEARCPCSGEPKPCPGTLQHFQESIKGEEPNLGKLKIGLSGLKRAITTNQADIANKPRIQNFLTVLARALKNLYSEGEIKTHIILINGGLDNLR